MTVTVTNSSAIAAPSADVLNVILDVAAYPSWLDGVLRVDILAHNEHGQPHQATFVIATPMGNVTYTAEYSYALDRHPQQVRWTLVSGTMIRALDGFYAITKASSETTIVEAELRLAVDLPLPQNLVHNAATTVVQRGLDGLQRRMAIGGSSHDGQ